MAETRVQHRQLAKLQASSLLGNPGVSLANLTAITLGATLAFSGASLGVADNAIGNTQLRQSAALSVIGRSANSTGNAADIAALSDGQVLRRSGVTLGFGAIDLASTSTVSGILAGANGGTGIANTGKQISLGGNLTTAGAFTTTLTVTNNTNVTLPTTGTLATLSGTESFTNKTLDNTNAATLKDTLFTLQDDGDATKQARFQLSGLTTATTRAYTLPDANTTLLGTDTTQTLTNKSIAATQLTGTLQSAQFPALTGDITTSSGSLATTIGALKVTNAMLAGSIAASKLVGTDIQTVGNITTGTWNAGQVTSILANTTAIKAISNSLASFTSIAVGRTGEEVRLAIAATGGNFAVDAVAGDGVIRVDSATSSLRLLTGVGSSALVITGSAITGGTWNGASIGAQYGGTGQTGYAIGDLLYASTTTALSKLAGVATGNALISGGVGSAPSWGKIGLNTHVSGTLGISNGGSGTTTQFTDGWVLRAGVGGVYTASDLLKVDSANFRLGVGLPGGTSPGATLHAYETTSVDGNPTTGIKSEQAGTGDACISYVLPAKVFLTGLDNSDSDSYKEGFTTQMGVSPSRIVTTTGETTLPLQPAFMAYNSATDTNVTGNGTAYAIICDTEIYDANGDYNNATGVFTAPVTANNYGFDAHITITGLTNAMTLGTLDLVTTSRTYRLKNENVGALRNNANSYMISGSIQDVQLTAGNTAFIRLTVTNGALVASVFGAIAPQLETYFSGGLIF